MKENEESFIKETERGEEVYKELHEMIKEYNKGIYGYGKASPIVEGFVAGLSEDDFYFLMRLPIGNTTRVHYTQMRNRVRKERRDALWVNYKNEKREEIVDFLNYLRKEGFKEKLGGGCPWVFVYLQKKEYAIGKAGIDMASERLIKQYVSINDFKKIYNIYLKTRSLDDSLINEILDGHK